MLALGSWFLIVSLIAFWIEAWVCRETSSNRKFLRLFSHHINYYTIQNNNSFIIEHGRLNIYNITGLDMNKYLYENDACFDRSITKFCIEILIN